jgi:membrane protein DedA with SNARE-associated domain
MPTTARQPFVDEDDSLTTEVIAGSAAGSVAALAMAFYLVNQRMGSVGVVILSLLCGAIVGGIVLTRVRRRLQRERTMGLDKLSETNGLLIWVRARSPEKEAQAREILVRHGGQAVHVHEIELPK